MVMANMKSAMKSYNFVCTKQLLKQMPPLLAYLPGIIAEVYLGFNFVMTDVTIM